VKPITVVPGDGRKEMLVTITLSSIAQNGKDPIQLDQSVVFFLGGHLESVINA